MAEPTKNSMVYDLLQLQKALPVMPKDTSNPFFKSKYTSLDTITELAFPIIHKHNFVWVTLPSTTEAGKPSLKYKLIHISGEKIEGEMELQLAKADPQGQGSAISYARRYAITSVLGIVSDADDDGEAARKAAEFAKKTFDEYKSPEEPSRDISDEPMSNMSKQMVKTALAKAGMGGTEVTKFCDFIINKPAPTTEADATALLNALKDK